MADGWRAGVYRMLSGGQLVPAADGGTAIDIDPATEEELARMPDGGKHDAVAAIDAAAAAFPAWRATSLPEAGFVWVNGLGQHFLGLPYGGVKQSGFGREKGLEQLLSFTQSKSVSLLTLNP